jgi:hypothetical protein
MEARAEGNWVIYCNLDYCASVQMLLMLILPGVMQGTRRERGIITW